MDKYLKCTDFIDCDNKVIEDKAYEVIKGLQTDKEKAVALYYFVRDEVKHNAYAPLYDLDRYKASKILEAGNGVCQQKAILLVALARVAGIPARIGLVDIRDHLISDTFKEMIGGINILPLHGYAEIYIDGKWIHTSPAYDIDICHRKRFVPVEFDGVNDAKDSPYDLDGNPHVEHLKYHGPYDDFPWGEIINYYKEWADKLGRDWDEFRDAGEELRKSKL
ncbi:MAG: transglutaminase domain-containing protein [Dehalococcoidia bacterium]|nr:MAG: transglutaminase domain-containing protein [Dehalococcoidia bacterium]